VKPRRAEGCRHTGSTFSEGPVAVPQVARPPSPTAPAGAATGARPATCARQPGFAHHSVPRRGRVTRTAALVRAAGMVPRQTIDRVARRACGPLIANGMRDAGSTAERRDGEGDAREEHEDHDDAHPDGPTAPDLSHGSPPRQLTTRRYRGRRAREPPGGGVWHSPG